MLAAIDNISHQIEARETTVLKGPRFSDKTTFLIWGCLGKPTAGMIMFRDMELVSLPERFLTDIRRQTPGFLCLPLIFCKDSA